MCLRYCARSTTPAAAAGIAVARTLDAIKRLEHALDIAFRDSGDVVADAICNAPPSSGA
jgi:hypothetical protein